MSILQTIFPQKVKFAGTKIDVHAGESIDPVLHQKIQFYHIRERMWTNKHTEIADIEAGFDIETTTTDKGAFMYKWQMVFGEYLLTGRTWDEWCAVMEEIQKAYNLGTEIKGKSKKKRTITRTFILWIANSGYEFQFYCRRKWNGAYLVQEQKDGTSDVFADGMRKPLKVMLSFTGTEDNPAITVYDALKFSTSLDQLAKDYCLTEKRKIKMPDGSVISDLDYHVQRNSQTPLTTTEDEYCNADVMILYEWAHYYNAAYLRQNGIAPMTSTGIIRHAVNESFDSVATRADYNAVLSLHPSMAEYYHIMQHLYRGGFTYANRAKAGKVLHDVVGKDFTSSYPAIMLQSNEFPVTPFVARKIASVEALEALEGLAWYADFEFTDLVQTRGISVENAYKLHEWKSSAAQCKHDTGAVFDNGKIAYAKKMTVTLTKQDFETYKRFYKWSFVKVSHVMTAEEGPLPDWFTRVVKFYYKKKAQLKLTDKKSVMYALSKMVVNGLYGLTVQKIHFDEVHFDPDTAWRSDHLHFRVQEDQERMEALYERAIGRDKYTMSRNDGKPKIVLSPYFGIYITALARKRIMDAIYELTSEHGAGDFVYCDTDSAYYQNAEAHAAYFDAWNSYIHAANNRDLIEPEFETLGDFDPVELDEHDAPDVYTYDFKTLGAKRYVKFLGDRMHTTVAGLPHGALRRRAAIEVGDDPAAQVVWVVNHFEDGLHIAAEEAIKNAHTYIDSPVDDLVTDPDGRSEYMHEESCIIIYPIDFTISVSPDYKEIMGMSVEEFVLLRCYEEIQKQKERF